MKKTYDAEGIEQILLRRTRLLLMRDGFARARELCDGENSRDCSGKPTAYENIFSGLGEDLKRKAREVFIEKK